MTLTRTEVGYRTSGRVVRHSERRVVGLHGNPLGAAMEPFLGQQVRRASTLLDGLHATGHTVDQPWTGSNWGTDVDAADNGGLGLSVIDTLHPTGPVHLIGWSMGAWNAAYWASQHPDRVASLTLISPALDILDLWQRTDGNPILGLIAEEIGLCWCDDADATESDVSDALTAGGADIATITSALDPLADRIWLVCALDDSIGLAPAAQTLATALGLPDERAVFFEAAPDGTHPAPYRPDLGWDPITTLRQVDRWT